MGKKKIIIAGAALLLVLGGGGGAYFMFGSKKPEPPPPVVEAPPKPPIYLPIEPINVPIIRNDNKRYVYSVAISLQFADDKQRDGATGQLPRLRDAFLRYANANPMPGQSGTDAIDLELLRARLIEQATNILGANAFDDILFIRVVKLMS